MNRPRRQSDWCGSISRLAVKSAVATYERNVAASEILGGLVTEAHGCEWVSDGWFRPELGRQRKVSCVPCGKLRPSKQREIAPRKAPKPESRKVRSVSYELDLEFLKAMSARECPRNLKGLLAHCAINSLASEATGVQESAIWAHQQSRSDIRGHLIVPRRQNRTEAVVESWFG